MALRVDYVVRETGTNLRRNITLTIATIVTIALTLTFVGASRLAQQGLDNSNVRFKGNVSFVVFMTPDATQAQVDGVERTLKESPQVKSTSYLDHDAAFAEFKRIFSDKPELYRNLGAADLPTNFKVFLKDGSSEVVLSLVEQFKTEPGVLDVTAPAAIVKQQENAFHTIGNVLVIGSIVIGASSLILIVNSIRVAMFARRREIEVMKLVGATNWFIRIPFMVEGLVQGIVGSIAGVFVIRTFNSYVLPRLVELGGIFAGFKITASDLQSTSLLIILIGAAIGISTSAVAATRYLDV